ncbi:MAG: hypothetical protein KC609_00675 [Myxococcales bacterium]|nr:hypothetical protein [Myxococcales bacterium]
MNCSELRYASLGALLLVAVACGSSGGVRTPALESMVCGGGTLLAVGDQSYCGYDRALQVTGFQCPALLPTLLTPEADVWICGTAPNVPTETIDALTISYRGRRVVEQPVVVRITNRLTERVFLNGFDAYPFDVDDGLVFLESACGCGLCGGGTSCVVPSFRWRLLELPAGATIEIEARLKHYAVVPVTLALCPEVAAISTACSEQAEFEERDYRVGVSYFASTEVSAFVATAETRYGLVVWEAPNGLGGGQLSPHAPGQNQSRTVRFGGETLTIALSID